MNRSVVYVVIKGDKAETQYDSIWVLEQSARNRATELSDGWIVRPRLLFDGPYEAHYHVRTPP